jgi:hypothetical protein
VKPVGRDVPDVRKTRQASAQGNGTSKEIVELVSHVHFDLTGGFMTASIEGRSAGKLTGVKAVLKPQYNQYREWPSASASPWLGCCA